MNVSNAAYHKPTTVYKPGLQKEGIDTTIIGEDAWYEPVEKVIPRVYHKYLKDEALEHIYGPAEEEEPEDPDTPDTPDTPVNPDQPNTPTDPTDPENPETPTEP